MEAQHVTVEHKHLGRQCSDTVTMLITVSHVEFYTV